MNKGLLIIAVLGMMSMKAESKVVLPHILSNGMVLQQQSKARIWGWDSPGTIVKVKASWSNDEYEVKTGSDGKWLVAISTPKASYDKHTITINDGDETVIKDVLSGEVWVCAGQSNMEMPVKGFGNCPVDNYNQEIINAADVKAVRSVKIPSRMAMTPQEDAQCEWKECSPATVGDFSATGYFFAKTVSKALGIPVGLIEANKGGTRAESWLDYDNLKALGDEPLDTMKIISKFKRDYHRPLVWGNGTFHPILNYTVAGIIYYQGCSNVGDPGNKYSERLALLVKQWRRDFKLGDIPFYFVEIAPYYYDNVKGTGGALLREQQMRAQQIIPNSALVCTNDLVYPYETTQIHPSQKQSVGERLAYNALNKTYGMKQIICDSPIYKSMTIKGDTVYVKLDRLEGAISRYEDIEGFEVAGADKVFHKANARYYWTKGIIITCPKVKNPVAVRYCFRNFMIGNVKNMGGLPLHPFRTDKW